MGWCHEFGTQVCEGCLEPMVAGAESCTCAACGTSCTGKFSGCPDVWARGPRRVTLVEPPQLEPLWGEHGRHDDPTATPAAPAQAAPAAPAAVPPQPSSQTVVTALLEAVAGLREDIRALSATVAEQQRAVDGLSDRMASAERAQTTEGGRQEFFLTRIEQVAFHLGQSLTQTSSSLAELKTETQRVAGVGELAHESLAVARQIERTSAQIEGHLADLSMRLEALGARIVGAVVPPVG
jgi:hypothetical protein